MDKNNMHKLLTLSPEVMHKMKRSRVLVPSPLALDENFQVNEKYQRLLTLYYIKAGAMAVIPGAHTGEFALNDHHILEKWLHLVKEMVDSYNKDMLLMGAIGGPRALKQAEMAAACGYEVVMLAPTAFRGLDDDGVITLLSDIASVIPVIAFELQRAIPGSYPYSSSLWKRIFDIVYGAKGASFDTYRSINMLEAAAASARRDMLFLFTGNDDRIVNDLSGIFPFRFNDQNIDLRYQGGLLGHFATDTHAAVNWVQHIIEYRNDSRWSFDLSEKELSHAVNCCNMALFDALGNFENSVWGVKHRLTRLGLLPAAICKDEKGRPGLAEIIDKTYKAYPVLCDDLFLKENLWAMKKEVGL